MILPYALSPYGNILLYTPKYSRHFTIAKGVQGRIDLTIPEVGSSGTVGVSEAPAGGVVEERKDFGSMNRML